MTEPNSGNPFAALTDMAGHAAHGDAWPEVKASQQAAEAAAIDAAQLAAARKARADRFNDLTGRACAVIIVFGLLAILAALAVAAWRWAL